MKINEYPEDEYFQDHPASMARRRERRQFPELNNDTPDTLVSLESRTGFSLEFFLSCLLIGIVAAVGTLLDSPIILLLSAALAPLMSPVTRLSLSIVIGSFRLFAQSVAGFLIGSAFIFGFGFVIGMLSHVWHGLSISQALTHAHLTIPDILILSLAVVWMAIALTRSDNKPVIPSILIAYQLALPLAVAGYGLGRGEELLWPDGLFVFTVYLSWAVLIGYFTLIFAGARPKPYKFWASLKSIFLLLVVAGLVAGTGFITIQNWQSIPLKIITPTRTPNFTLPPTRTPTPITPTPSPTITQVPTTTFTPTLTPSITPTPFFVVVNIESGALIRSEPSTSAKVITSAMIGTQLRVLDQVTDDVGTVWAHIVVMKNGVEGWVVVKYIATLTPTPQ
ncbi:MAG: DUF389 domain-containing protein [Anaerolineaceae bacterium]